MEKMEGGGCSPQANKAIATIGLITGAASLFGGPIGAIIFGPAALGMAIASFYCAYSK
ncbi:hypothetical protein ES705_26450 [subsurface metagenome]